MRDYLPRGVPFTLVDVGAGAGLCGEFLARDRPNATYEFIEPIDSLRHSLRNRYGARADAGDKADFGTSEFVTLLDVLEHQQDDGDFLRSLVAKMRPGATLLVTVPALQNLWSEWDVALGHFRRYDKGTLLQSAEGLPLVIEEVSFLFPEMVPVGKFRARKKKQSPSGRDCDSAEFPDLPGLVNDVLYGVGTVSLALRRKWTTGTSLLMVATVTG